MQTALVDDELWELIQPQLPRRRRRCRYPGRRRFEDRLVLSSILFVLSTGIAWQRLPQELGFGMTCWRSLRDWQQTGVFERLHQLLLPKLRHAERLHGLRPIIGKRRTEHGSGLGTQRWVVERTLSWLHQYRRLRVRYERRADIHEAFLSLACSLICYAQLKNSFC